jgi:aspartokinase
MKMEKIKAGGIIQNANLVKIGLNSVPNRPGIASKVFSVLGKKGINVQFIVQAIELNSRANMTLCVGMEDMEIALSAINEIKAEVQPELITNQPNVAIVSVFGPHFRDYPGIAAVVFSTLASVDINILAISTSISTISCVIDGERLTDAVNAISEKFDVPAKSIYTATQGVSLRSKSR